MSTTTTTPPVVTSRIVRFRLERETKGAGKYNEIDENGIILNPFSNEAAIGTLYVRKNTFGRMGYHTACPLDISITLTCGHNAQ